MSVSPPYPAVRVIYGALGGNDDPRESPIIARLRALARDPAPARRAWLASPRALASQAVASGRTAEAIRLLERARLESPYPDPDTAASLSELRAIRRLEQRLEVRPNDAAALAELSKMYFVQELDERARECLRRVISLTPRNAEPHWLLGVSYHCHNEFDAAVAEYRITLSLHPGHRIAATYLPQAEAHLPPRDLDP